MRSDKLDLKHWKVRDEQDALLVGRITGVNVKDIREEIGQTRSRVVVPRSLQEEITEEIHNTNHAGIWGTYSLLRRDHWFRGMKEVVKMKVVR